MGKSINVDIKTSVYPLEAIYAASYQFIDRAYIRLDEKGKGTIRVILEPKEDAKPAAIKRLAGDFRNELLHHGLRLKVSSANQKIREYVVTRALLSAQQEQPSPDGAAGTASPEAAVDQPRAVDVGPDEEVGPDGKPRPKAQTVPGGIPLEPNQKQQTAEDDALAKEIQKLLAEIDKGSDQEDPLGITAPWEEKDAKKPVKKGDRA